MTDISTNAGSKEQPVPLDVTKNLEVKDAAMKEELENEHEDNRIGVERTLAFTDACIAISMTLLILPLMEGTDADKTEGITTAEWYEDHLFPILAFVFSFLVVASFWRENQELCSSLEYFSPRLVRLTFIWVLVMTYIPVSTSLIYNKGNSSDSDEQEETGGPDRIVHLQYLLNLLLARFFSVLMALEVALNRDLWKEHCRPKRRILVEGIVTLIVLGVACGLSQTGMGMFGVLLLLIVNPVVWVLEKTFPSFKGRFGQPAVAYC
ncbi:Protein of unknown function (DUF1211) [Seminavis robusta]|uniref:Transmembrane protein 175 n=1 Tax=Seminavis robusta TaxID=568900 RepID=A0A9N8DDA4_9STRA|nr:Protein of unknown function (DUF1211) [Seminavis robusta]|eukprot:Sro94_g048950.1 Protein of unknown function (DUF1211) (265) ;mRNA; r:47582-48376